MEINKEYMIQELNNLIRVINNDQYPITNIKEVIQEIELKDKRKAQIIVSIISDSDNFLDPNIVYAEKVITDDYDGGIIKKNVQEITFARKINQPVTKKKE